MKNMNLLLNEAEREWREEVREDFPLRSDTPIIRDTKPNGRDWTFSTDLQKIFASISNDPSLQEKFKSFVTKYWDGNPEELARDTLHYLLFHELYHPIEAPFSVVGDDNDNKRIHQAIRRGVVKAEPKLSPLEQVLKVQTSQNGVKDFILDNRFYLDNSKRGYVRKDVIPIWDILELQKTSPQTNFYTITRLLYGLMYGPESTHTFFEDKSGKEGHELAEKALSALLGHSVKLPKKKDNMIERAKKLLKFSDNEDYKTFQDSVQAVREVFTGENRYDGIERFMKVLGPYIEKGMPQGRSDIQGEPSGTSPQNILQDLLDDMNPSEQQQFIQGLEQENQSALEQAASQIQSTSTKPMNNVINEMRNLDLLATHEFYKRNHPRVHIIGGKKIGESVIVGKRDNWDLKNSTVVTEDQLSKINLRRIDIMQKRTRLPWLIDLGNGTYRLNEYELKQSDVKDIVYRDVQIDVPDVTEFYLDSSGSMGSSSFKANDGSRWDMLSHVLYGFIDALFQGGKQVKKQSRIRIHNFANKQVSSELIPVEQFWEGDTSALGVLFKPNNGYDYEDLNIGDYNDSHKRTYVIATDGELVIDGRSQRESKKMRRLAKIPSNHVILFEIGGTYSLGEAVKSDKNIFYSQVHNKEQMLQAGLEVLLSK